MQPKRNTWYSCKILFFIFLFSKYFFFVIGFFFNVQNKPSVLSILNTSFTVDLQGMLTLKVFHLLSILRLASLNASLKSHILTSAHIVSDSPVSLTSHWKVFSNNTHGTAISSDNTAFFWKALRRTSLRLSSINHLK